MQNIEINLTLSKTEYPILFQLKKKEMEKIVNKIFNLGYSILYPKPNINDRSFEHKEIVEKIESLRAPLQSKQSIQHTSPELLNALRLPSSVEYFQVKDRTTNLKAA